ncbi:MAG: peptidoglycan DD-metalloendopeptidase family protein [Gammaproteobacteria bacterium]|nr:peptidoglycan DD-metalloendopeptidase family protein [Gammaproteobacteria bacterium]
MRSTLKTGRLQVVLLVGIAVCTASVSAASTQQDLEKKLARVQTQIQASQFKIEKHRGEAGTLETELREFERKIGQLNHQLGKTESELKRHRAQVQTLESRKQGLLKQLSRHRNVLYAQLRSEYLYGGQEKLKLLLNQEEHAKLGRTLVFYDYLHRARVRKIEQANTILQDVHQVQDEIEEEQRVATRTRTLVLDQKQEISAQQMKRKDVLARIQARVSDEQARLANLEISRQQLQELLDELLAALINIPYIDQDQDFRKVKGKLFWPVAGKPSNRYGQKRKFSRRTLYWQGVFIPGKTGNDVYSIFHGRVVFAEWMRGLGLLTIIDHGNGYMSLYGHSQSLYKRPGEWVKAGERIASVGNSGGHSRTGVYFEIRRHGKPVNPQLWCKKPAPSGQTS